MSALSALSGLSMLDRKLLRDLWRLRGQVVAVAMVVASGVALLVMALSTYTSLRATTEAYYARYRFADVFATAKRAPEGLVERIRAIPGVQTVETRVSAFTTVDVADLPEPVVTRLVSLPERGQPLLNGIALRAGRAVTPRSDNEAVVLEPFADAHHLGIGDSLTVLINGTRRKVRIVGIALSPEYVYAIAPGMLMPDDARFGVLWMSRKALAAAYDLDGAFNDVSLALLRGAQPAPVIDRLDKLLNRYGGTGAVARADQISNWFLMNEFTQLKTIATLLPAIFLAVAAFLTNTVLARLIATERREISLMKAFGYSNLQVGAHYAKMALAMAAVGVLIGAAVGAALGRYETALYSDFYRFPFLHYRPSGTEFALGAIVSLASALFGAIWAVRRAVVLPPAEAMRPPAPEHFRSGAVLGLLSPKLDRPTRIVLRQVARTPFRFSMSVAGVALAVGVLLMAMQWWDAIDRLARSHFDDSLHQDVTVGFFDPRPMEARFELARLPGVLAAEPVRIAPAILTAGRHRHRGAVTGLPADARLQVIYDVRGWTLPVPGGGLVLGTKLAEKLHVGVGDTVTVQILDGARPTLQEKVTGLHETDIGVPAYMALGTLNRQLREPAGFGYANLLVDPAHSKELYTALKGLPGVSSVMVKQAAIDIFYQTLGDTILIFISFFVAFTCALAMGVIYNAVRVALSERGRELATLRVLGFSRWEIFYILVGEAGLVVLAALPLGCLAGMGLVWIMSQGFETELYRVPPVLYSATFANAILIILAASAIAAVLVRRRLDRLDLIAVLKTRE